MSGARDENGGWLRDAAAIYEESFRLIAREADFSHLPAQTRHIAARIIHACGLPQLATSLRISASLQKTVENALRKSCQIFTDTEMTRAGLMQKLLPPHVKVHCLLRDERVRHLSEKHNVTLTAAAVDCWRFQPESAICIIGNAPTALFRLMERIMKGELRPAAVLAFPVGFVGAAEAKQLWYRDFMRTGHDGATMLGRAGGAGMAAAAFNAILLASFDGKMKNAE